MNTRFQRIWRAFTTFAILFSFTVNLILILVLILAIGPLLHLKTHLLEPLLINLDQAFLGLGETVIQTTVPVDQPVHIQFNLPLDQPLGLDFDLPIHQETVVVLTQPVPLELPARFILPGGGGVINGSVSLALPAGLRLPVRLNMAVPVETTIPVQMTVPVSQTVPIRMAIPVAIPLGPSGLDPAVQRLRAVFVPARTLIESLPDGIRFRSSR
ncbi:MAG: hypothetical protein RML46_06935 [Anaerolineae bacterium]|nr:hypothetical protein [Anaerolineae bacterium]MDW8068628.1 hypothetical protein [Anaerolineae bacterium]